MRQSTLWICFFVCGFLLLHIPQAFAQSPLTEKLLNFKPPLKPLKKPAVPKTGEIEEKALLTYQKIFAHQKQAKWQEADFLMSSLKDKRLMGYVLRERYLHPTEYTSTFAELQTWLDKYYDHGGSSRIYKLAVKKNDGEATGLKSPKTVKTIHRYIDITRRSKSLYSGNGKRSVSQTDAFKRVASEVKSKTRSERPTEALGILNSNKSSLSRTDFNRLKARIAASYMHEGKITKALQVAKEAVDTVGPKVPYAAWVAGLSSWRKKQFKDSAKYFEVAAGSEYANAWTRAGGAFWASRAHMREGNFDAVSLWLKRAASEPRTFYGLIATRALSKKLDFDWSIDPLDTSQKILLNRIPAGARGIALTKLGFYKDAEHEFKFVEKTENLDIRRAAISVANDMKSAGIAWRGASYLIMQKQDNVPLAAQYPEMLWQSKGTYSIDPALLHAIIRQESKFNPSAGNPSGASGLMQLLPSTGRGIMGHDIFEAAGGDRALFEPEFNVRAGQKYVHELFKRYVPNKNLFDLLIAWNAGPGNLLRWKKSLKNISDPLLFIETIPVAETRAFVERVMTNYWLYQDRFGRKTPSLDAVAEGKWPIYIYQ